MKVLVRFKDMKGPRSLLEKLDEFHEPIFLEDEHSKIEIRSMQDIFCFDLSQPLWLEIEAKGEKANAIWEKIQNCFGKST